MFENKDMAEDQENMHEKHLGGVAVLDRFYVDGLVDRFPPALPIGPNGEDVSREAIGESLRRLEFDLYGKAMKFLDENGDSMVLKEQEKIPPFVYRYFTDLERVAFLGDTQGRESNGGNHQENRLNSETVERYIVDGEIEQICVPQVVRTGEVDVEQANRIRKQYGELRGMGFPLFDSREQYKLQNAGKELIVQLGQLMNNSYPSSINVSVIDGVSGKIDPHPSFWPKISERFEKVYGWELKTNENGEVFGAVSVRGLDPFV